ncbi:MAG: hypothetical protein AAFY97_00590 [Pseudomonadota bacterium]
MPNPNDPPLHSRMRASRRDLSLFAAVMVALLATPVSADITARFIEGAPKDRFVLENTGACAEGPLDVTIDLAPAPAGLIFDTTSAGAGVEVFQPFEVVAGADVLTDAIIPTDGDQAVRLNLTGLAPGARFAFTVDVDDTGTASELGQIRVSDSEMSGAELRINGETAVFGTGSVALIEAACLS